MDLTTEEIANKHGLAAVWPNLDAALNEYAAQEAKSYQSWLNNQVLAGRTQHKLWMDYKAEVLDQRPSPLFLVQDAPKNLVELAKLEEQATPAPWFVHHEAQGDESGYTHTDSYLVPQEALTNEEGEHNEIACLGSNDGEFIAALRNALPDLLAENARLRAAALPPQYQQERPADKFLKQMAEEFNAFEPASDVVDPQFRAGVNHMRRYLNQWIEIALAEPTATPVATADPARLAAYQDAACLDALEQTLSAYLENDDRNVQEERGFALERAIRQIRQRKFLHPATPVATVESELRQPWGDGTWDDYLARQREKAQYLQNQNESLQKQVATAERNCTELGALSDYFKDHRQEGIQEPSTAELIKLGYLRPSHAV